MELRQLGTSDIKITPVVFGAWAIGGTFWGGSDDDLAVDAIRASLDAGVNAIDTAPSYGFGRSERVVGRAIQGRRDDVVLCTKFGIRSDRSDGTKAFTIMDEYGAEYQAHWISKPDSIIEECEQSLSRLGVDTIDVYQCHIWDKITPIEYIIETMDRLREQGKIRTFGVSNFGVDLLEQCVQLETPVCDQPKYSPIDRRIENDVLPFCRDHNIGLIVYSCLERGLLTGRVTMDREFPEGDSRRDSGWFQRENRGLVLDALRRIEPVADAHDATLAQLIINWVARQPGITAAIVGARTPEQSRENAGALSFKLTDSEQMLIRSVFEQLTTST